MEYVSGYSMYKIIESYMKSTETQKKIILEWWNEAMDSA